MFIKTDNMKSNADLQRDVQDAIKWEPLLSAAEIGVIAKEGVITLTEPWIPGIRNRKRRG
jgi:hypothetical protein